MQESKGDDYVETFDKGDWAWIYHTDPAKHIVPVTVLSPCSAGDTMHVRHLDGQEETLSPKRSADAIACDKGSLTGAANLVELNDLSESTILFNVRRRFEDHTIYTNVGTILVVVNPFKALPDLYTPEKVKEYYDDTEGSLEPHIYIIASRAYRDMMDGYGNQSVIISGESGAGKTYTTKHVLGFLADVSKNAPPLPNGIVVEGLEQAVLDSNPLMEAFGNAQTLRNNNSSRFGKYIDISFHPSGRIVGANIINYLLEKSRLVYQAAKERNYHIFYQIFTDSALAAKWNLTAAKDYAYLNRARQSGPTKVSESSIDDVKEFADVKAAMATLNMAESEQDFLFRVVAAVLHLGNIEFEVKAVTLEGGRSEEQTCVSNLAVLRTAADTLQVDDGELAKVLTSVKVMNTRRWYPVDRAGDARDGLAKALYGELFNLIIGRINSRLSKEVAKLEPSVVDSLVRTGILDIFGFEEFKSGNYFEQLCINYCNEKLQNHFNEHIFKEELKEYQAQLGADFKMEVDFQNNDDTLALIDGGPSRSKSLLSIIKACCQLPTCKDEKFLADADAAFGNKAKPSHASYVQARSIRDGIFTVVHYAGPVPYLVEGIIEKNKDLLPAELRAAICASTNADVSRLLAQDDDASDGGRTRKRDVPIGIQFQNQLTDLMKTLKATSPHFVRCMKTNHDKKPWNFHSKLVVTQMNYAGLLQVCRVRRDGYPVRRDFSDFFGRYGMLGKRAPRPPYVTGKPPYVSPPATKTAVVAFVRELEGAGLVDSRRCRVGESKVLMKYDQEQSLERARTAARAKATLAIQSACRRRVVRAVMNDLKSPESSAETVQAAIERGNRLCGVAGLPRPPALKAASDRLKELKAAEELDGLLTEALQSWNKALLEQAWRRAKDSTNPKAAKVKARLDGFAETVAAVDNLRAAIDSGDLTRVRVALDAARDLDARASSGQAADGADASPSAGLSETPEFKDAEKLLHRQALREKLPEKLAAAARSDSLVVIDEVLDEARGLEMMQHPQVEAAQRRRGMLVKRSETLAHLEDATLRYHAAFEASGAGTDAGSAATAVRATFQKLTTELQVPDTADVLSPAKKVLSDVERHEEQNKLLMELAAAQPPDEGRLMAEWRRARDEYRMDDEVWQGVSRCAAVGRKLEAKEQAVQALEKATADGNVGALAVAIAKASALDLKGTPSFLAADKALEAGCAADPVIGNIQLALKSTDVALVEAALEEADAAPTPVDPNLRVALELLHRELKAETRVVAGLEQAMMTYNTDSVKSQLAKAYDGSPLRNSTILDRASAFLDHMKVCDDATEAMETAAKAKDRTALAGALDDARELLALPLPFVVAGGRTPTVAPPLEAAVATHTKTLQRLDMLAQLDMGLKNAIDRPSEPAQEKLDALESLLAEATKQRFASPNTLTARAEIRRIKRQHEANWLLENGMLNEDLAMLNAGLQLASEIELYSQLTDDAAEVREQLQEEANMCRPLTEAMHKLRLKPADEYDAGDMRWLDETVDDAAEAGVDPKAQRMREAKNLRREMKEAIELRERIEAALARDSVEPLNVLQELIDRAETIQLTGSFLSRLRVRVAEMQRAVKRSAGIASYLPATSAEKLATAGGVSHAWHLYRGLRAPRDYARVLLSAGAQAGAEDQFHRWQPTPIVTSLMNFSDKRLTRLALRAQRSILGFTGELDGLPYPPTLAQDVLQIVLETPALADEVYAQLCKHLTANPSPTSERNAWQLFAIFTSTFPPSRDFLMCVLNFLKRFETTRSIAGVYARYCMHRVLFSFQSGPSEYVPSGEVLRAFTDRHPALVNVELADGTALVESYPVPPDITVAELYSVTCNTLRLDEAVASGLHFQLFPKTPFPPTVSGGAIASLVRRLPQAHVALEHSTYPSDLMAGAYTDTVPLTLVFRRELFPFSPLTDPAVSSSSSSSSSEPTTGSKSSDMAVLRR